MEVTINGTRIQYLVKGTPFVHQDDSVLANQQDSLAEHTPWNKAGFVIQPLFENEVYSHFLNDLQALLIRLMEEAGIGLPNGFSLDRYHEVIGNDYSKHLQVVEKTKLVDASRLPVPFNTIERRVSEICGIDVMSKKPYNGERVFHFRIIRPSEGDFNPLHKDVWQEENEGAINLYFPIVGSNEKSSLIIAEGSHLLPEDTFVRSAEGASMGNIKFNVPGLMSSKVPLNFVRPNPQGNEVLVFSPYLIHGGAANLNVSTTRVSLEMRFWRR